MLLVVYALGWVGTAIYLINYAYLGLAAGVRHARYFAANAVAAGLLTVSSFALGSWQSVFINGFWLVVSVLALRAVTLRVGKLSRIHLLALVLVMLVSSLFVWLQDERQAVALLGWSSACAFCGSYLLFSSHLLSTDEFHLFNGYAATALLPQLWRDENWPVLALELCWLVLSVIAYSRHARKGLGLPAELE